ncbi:hypothetical protein [Streptomyces prunicolor]
MADKPSAQDTIKNLLGDIADSSNKAFNDFLDPPNKSNKSDFPDWFGSGNPMAALAGTPLGALQAMAAFGGGMNPAAALAGANPLALLAGASSDRGSGPVNPLAALANANPLAALAGATHPAVALAGLSGQSSSSNNPLAAFGQLAGAAAGLPGAVGGLGGLAESLATLPQQIARLTDLLSTLVSSLDAISDVAASTGVRPPAKKG